MAQAWALVAPDNTFRIVTTASLEDHPASSGNEEACAGVVVWPIVRDLKPGERVSLETGEILFDAEHRQPGEVSHTERLLEEIKNEANRRILAVSPVWRQLNDVRKNSPEASARFARIDQIRAWSQELEDRIEVCNSVKDVEALRADIAKE